MDKVKYMIKRFLFVIVYVLWMPLGFLAVLMAFFAAVFIAPIVWICTGDEDKSWDVVYGGLQGWLVELPYKIFGYKMNNQ